MARPKTAFGFVLTRRFTLSPFALFVDTLRLAGDEADRSEKVRYDWQVLDTVGLPIRSSCGVEVNPTARLGRPEDFDQIVVCGGLLAHDGGLDGASRDFLRAAAAKGIPISALCTGSFVLAELGLLDGYRACVSWFHIAEFRAAFPRIEATAEPVYLIDRDRATCPGGAGAADLAARLVRRDLGRESARKASHILLFDRPRDSSDRQPRGALDLDVKRPKVRRAIDLMEADLERRLAIGEIADKIGCTTRQLERDFLAETGKSPGAVYLELRMARARHLVVTTDLAMITIAAEVGFVDAAHFGKRFREHFGCTPTAMRAAERAAGDRDGPQASGS
jgi:transcriptional regulator GlxA family with amidase domain